MFNIVSDYSLAHIRVKFNGVVEVKVPKNNANARALWDASKDVALAMSLATIDNPDCGEILDDICEKFIKNGGTEEIFDKIQAVGISGNWEEYNQRKNDIMRLALLYLLANLDDANLSCCTSTEDDDAIVINGNEQEPIREDEIVQIIQDLEGN